MYPFLARSPEIGTCQRREPPPRSTSRAPPPRALLSDSYQIPTARLLPAAWPRHCKNQDGGRDPSTPTRDQSTSSSSATNAAREVMTFCPISATGGTSTMRRSGVMRRIFRIERPGCGSLSPPPGVAHAGSARTPPLRPAFFAAPTVHLPVAKRSPIICFSLSLFTTADQCHFKPQFADLLSPLSSFIDEIVARNAIYRWGAQSNRLLATRKPKISLRVCSGSRPRNATRCRSRRLRQLPPRTARCVHSSAGSVIADPSVG